MTTESTTEFKYSLNVPLVDNLMDWVKRSRDDRLEENEPIWDQELWFQKIMETTLEGMNECGTACCAAGYIGDVAQVLGPNYLGDMVPQQDLLEKTENHLGISWSDWRAAQFIQHVPESDKKYGVPWEIMGAYFLGIRIGDARSLFSASNDSFDLEEIVRMLKEKY